MSQTDSLDTCSTSVTLDVDNLQRDQTALVENGTVNATQPRVGSSGVNANENDEEDEEDDKGEPGECCCVWPWFLKDRPVLR